MWKPLLVLAVAATMFFITPSEGSSYAMASASASASADSSSSHASAYSESSANSPDREPSRTEPPKDSSPPIPTQPPSKPKCTKPNEVFDPCPIMCPPRECGVNPAVILCRVPPKLGDPECEPGCRCRDGYLRNYNGTCIPKDECPTCPVNEVYVICPAPCPPRRCDVDDRVISCGPPPQPGDPNCEPGCRCVDAYARNYDGVCVPRDQCPRCPINEVYDECPAPCPPRRCGVDERLIRCAAPPKPGDPECEPGCRCIDGYVRNFEDVCVPKDQCPKCTQPHEIWVKCPPSCPPQTCESLFEKYNCPNEPVSDSEKKCEGACRCEPGYLRNKIGECISEENCRKCCGPHEYFSCGGACDNVCATLSTKNQTNCPYVNVMCNPMCYCEANYARDDRNICIPIEQCPVPQCGAHEVYSECPAFACRPLQCSEVGYPVSCPVDKDVCPGKPGCICEEGYVRDDWTGVCIPIRNCPSCGGDVNATSGCGVNCGRHCSDYKNKDIACIQVCYENACDCKDGYLMDETIKKCVLPQDCTLVCGANEVYSNCSNGGCGPKECSQLGFKIGCVKMDQKYCKEGCLCKDGYLRDDKGVCIPKSECPACGGDPNAVTGCGVNCGRLCSNYNKGPVGCAAVCYDDACDCRDGFVLDETTGLCVCPDDCKPQCGENEQLESCPDMICTPRNCSQLGMPWPAIPCPPPNDNCTEPPVCVCIDDYVRDDQGKCIPKKECPSCGGDPNAVSGCGVNCGKLCSNYDKGPVPCPKICYPNACDCKDGFVLDKNLNKCVSPEECTQTCGLNEVYDSCANGGCRKWKCCEPIICVDPSKCEGGCICQDGYTRDDKGNCIPEDQCPAPTCGLNEVYDSCANGGCRKWKCSEPIICVDPIKCEGGCICQDGYTRDDKGNCIPEDQCPEPQCGENEELESCPDMICTPRNCSQLGMPWPAIPCPPPNDNCTEPPVCVCIDGYVRDDQGKCIPKKECPSCGGDPNAVSGCGINCGKHCSDYKKKHVMCPLICKWNSCDCKDGYVYDDNLGICVCPDDCTPTCGLNEVYDSCANGGCRKWKCSEPIICVDPSKCEGGCICQDGYTRDDKGNCIPEDQCPVQCNKPNEYYDDCAPSCPPQTCESIGKKYHCPIQPAVCKGACRCKKGFYRNKLEECIAEEDCKRCNGPHEYFSCGGACDNVCATLNKQNQTNCPIYNIDCNRMCYCEKDYARDENNICIPIDKCPEPLCPDDQRYEECPDNLCEPLACSELGFPINCPPPDTPCPGEPGCVCDYGKVRDDNGNCIPREQCPSCGGDPNAVSGCGSNCGRRCSNYKQKNVVCPLSCILNGCDCKDGYVYDDNLKKCVHPKHCTPTCGINEIYSRCANGGCRRWKCSQPKICKDPRKCKEGCICLKGYTRADNGTCIPEDQCPAPVCGPNETWEECPDTLCLPQTCSQLGFGRDICPDVPDGSDCPGSPGCVCDYGYVRNLNGDCVPADYCPSCGGDPHAVLGCGNHCGNRCIDYVKKDVPCRLVCYFNACDCKKGYVYDEQQKKCVRLKKCSPVCGDNEVYSECINGGCLRQNCSQLGKPVPCVKIDPKYCIKGCLCKDKYLRADNGTCIPEDQCPQPVCGPNERWEECPDTLCSPQTCSQLGFGRDICPDVPDGSECPGSPGCVCDYGYVRNHNGDCIPAESCPSCGGDPHAVTGCGNHCGNRCIDYKIKDVPCRLVCYFNACDCKKGYVYDEKQKKCVRLKHCSPICGKNEVYDSCANGGCDKRNCSQLGEPMLCIDPIECQGGCVCEKGYLRAENGICVPENECPEQCNGPNEYYDHCAPSCPPQTCESIGKIYDCPPEAAVCRGACRCKKGYRRNKIGECISKKDCKKCTGPHEYFSCGGACDNVCATLSTHNQTHCPIINIKCNPKCYCEEGYARDDNNICIPIDECPEPVCGPNERLEECPDTLCSPQTCSQLGFGRDICPDVPDGCECPGSPGCVCDYGYVRNLNGDCIPVKDCPSCGGDPNAVSGCGNHCGNQCTDYKKKNVTCPLICYFNACDCKKGRVYDAKQKRCVRPKDCSPICGKNEVYDSCANGGCDKRNCSQLGEPMLCIDPIECQGGCVCEKGYLRAKNGTCVPINQCPAPCTKPHEYYDLCPPICPPQTCDSIGKVYPCPMIPSNNTAYCYGACRCENGYYRNTMGECILKEDCLKCTGPNEYFSCGSACDNVCATIQKQNKTNCPIKNKKCNPKCYCEDGYARDDNNICIPIDQCGETCNDDPNAVPGCGLNCGRHCSDYNNNLLLFCPDICEIDACDCKDNYFYDDNLDKCVLPEDCTPTCGDDEVFNDCINGGCQKKNCSQLGKPDVCVRPKECIKGCLCKDGYLRHDNGTCVPVDQCEALICGANEVYDACSNGGCDIRKCSELSKPNICEDPTECIGDCVCKHGYLRDENGVCVPESDCKPECGLHEVYNPCPPNCPPNTCESIGKMYSCTVESFKTVKEAVPANLGIIEISLDNV